MQTPDGDVLLVAVLRRLRILGAQRIATGTPHAQESARTQATNDEEIKGIGMALHKTWTKKEADRWLADMKAKRAVRKAVRKARKSPRQIESDERAERYQREENRLLGKPTPPPAVHLVAFWEGRPDSLAEREAYHMEAYLQSLGYRARQEYDAAGQLSVLSNAPMNVVRNLATVLPRLAG